MTLESGVWTRSLKQDVDPSMNIQDYDYSSTLDNEELIYSVGCEMPVENNIQVIMDGDNFEEQKIFQNQIKESLVSEFHLILLEKLF